MDRSPGGRLVPRSKYLLAFAVATFVVGVLQALSIVELPFAAWFSALTGSVVSLSALNNFMGRYGYASIFVLMGLESASLPVPSEVVLPLAGYLVYTGVLSFWPVVVVSTVASLAGALVDYLLAARLGRPFVSAALGRLHVHQGALERAEGWFARWGQWTVFAARFVPFVRTVISLPAGLFEMKVRPFVALTLAGCFAWSVILVYAGYLASAAGQSWSATFSSSSAVVQLLSAAVAATSAAYMAYYAYSGVRIHPA